ncbi:FxLYD domain-containing protein [Oceanirhabdus sp. W0125-5]|uniref:FxLYD domain-containing protein n=1 Tax=Oceanirhabdus sp. W0125-5 TaxID=2999116 RepID=UPI0022F3415A|nr:FxLYD domain-containing protein [Oceanirhabdus sp. W0125-5]WBW97756.1 FxLYD domain-containing protein [Oceanirhabdus sp. W0125-5]
MEVRKKFYNKWWFYVGVIIIILSSMVTVGFSNRRSEPRYIHNDSFMKDSKFEIIGELTAEKDAFGAVYIEGVIKNNSGKKYVNVEIIFNLYDLDGNQIGTAIAKSNTFDKHGQWKFRAVGIGANGDVASYKLIEVRGL